MYIWGTLFVPWSKMMLFFNLKLVTDLFFRHSLVTTQDFVYLKCSHWAFTALLSLWVEFSHTLLWQGNVQQGEDSVKIHRLQPPADRRGNEHITPFFTPLPLPQHVSTSPLSLSLPPSFCLTCSPQATKWWSKRSPVASFSRPSLLFLF